MSRISIEVITQDGTKSYLPVGCRLSAIDGVTGAPLDLHVAIDRGELIAHINEPNPTPE